MGNTISDRNTVVNEFKKIKSDAKEEEISIPYYQWLQILEEEIRNEGWNDDVYNDIKIKNTSKPKEENFCKWIKTQKELFEKIKNIGTTKITWSWDDEPLNLIKSLLNKYHKNTKYQLQECGDINNITLTVENGKENKDEINVPASHNCTLSTIEGLCIPRRRRQLNLKNIYNTLKDIESNLNSNNADLNEKLKSSILATTALGSIGQLAKNQIIELYKKYNNKDNIICNVLKRNFSDYNNIINSNDIFDDSTSKNIQCKIQEIRKKIENKEDIEQLWKTNFQEPFQNQLKDIDELKDPDTGKPCQVDSNYTIPQCVRFFEEWLEEFLDEKSFVEKYLYSACNEKNGKRFKNKGYLKCDDYCKHYKNILQLRKQCYENYLKKCKGNNANDAIYQAEIDVVTRRIMRKIHCDDTVCSSKNMGGAYLSPLFDENNENTNLIYYCNCHNRNNRKDQAPCKDISAISGNLSLKGDWKTAAKDASTKRGAKAKSGDDLSDPCDLDYKEHSFGGKGVDACDGRTNNYSSWKCGDQGFCFPPRRQRLCISNIRKLGDGDVSTFNSNKLLLEVMLAAKQEGERLWKESVSNSRNYDNFCQNIKRSYYDFENIITGTDKMKDQDGNDKLEDTLKSIFHQIYKQLHDTQKNKYGNDSDINYTKLRENWWNENRDDIWNAFICGTKQYVPRITSGKITFGGDGNKSLVCESKDLKKDSPPDDNVPQFLRWFEEWAQHFCVKRKQEQQLVDSSCKNCNGDSCDNGLRSFFFTITRSIGCNCKEQCDKYSKWMDTQKSQFDKQKNKYNQLKGTLEYMSFTDSGNKNASQYLDEKFSETKCKINNNNGLRFDSSKTFSSYPNGYEQKCSKCSPQLEVYLGKKNDRKNEKTACEISDRDIMNGGMVASCNTEKTYKKKWDCNITSKLKSHSNICVPKRTKELCLGYLEHQKFKEHITENNGKGSVNEKFLKGIILEAKQEGKKIWEYYVGKQNSHMNKKKEACKIMKRNFADLGNIIKGTSLWNKNNDQIENKLKEIFEKIWEKRPDDTKYLKSDTDLPSLRNDWWDSNKDAVWEAMKCEGTGNECGKHDDIDKKPQLLRWLEEWSENFCDARKKKLNDMKENCTKCKEKMTKEIDENTCEDTNCKECKNECNEYKTWKEKWKANWDTLLKYFNEEKDQNDSELYTYLKSNGKNEKEIHEIIKNGFDQNTNCTYEKTLQKNSDIMDTPHEYSNECDCTKKIELAKKAAKNAAYIYDEDNKLGQNICENTFEDGWIEWDCSKTDSNGYSVCMKRNPNIDEKDYEFVEWFEEWIESFLDEYEQFKDDTECIKNTNNNTNSCVDDTCRDKCYCYNKWAAKRKLEWELLQKYYKEYDRKNSDGLGSSTGSDFLDIYLETRFSDQFEPLNGIYETPTQQMISKFKDAVMKSEKCVEKCPKKLSCEEKGFVTEWECEKTNGYNDKICVKKGDEEKYKVNNLSAVSEIDRFYDSFNDWLNDSEHMLEENMKLLEYSCNKKKTYKYKNANICFRCKNNCKCYDTLKNEIKKQWTQLKCYYDHYKNEEESKMHNIDLETYLEAQCEYNLTEMGNQHHIAEKQCKKKDTNKDTIFDEMVDNIDKKKDNVCDVCNDDDKYDEKVDANTCSGIVEVLKDKCNEKTFDGLKADGTENKTWQCKKTSADGTLQNDVCVPARGQSICVATMYDSYGGGNGSIRQDAFKNETKMKESLKAAIKIETTRLWTKFGSKDKEKACRLIHRSFNDYKHMVLGDSIWKPGSIGGIEKEIGKTIPQNGANTSGTASTEERQTWWKQHEKEFWEAVKCGIKAANSSLSGNECPRFISEDDQFEWWAKEWSEDYYEKRHEVLKEFDTKCTKDKDGKSTECNSSTKVPNGDCGKECEKYQKFLTKKRNEWNDNFKKYLKDQETTNPDKYSDEIVYLLNPCTYQSCDKAYITALLNGKTYGDKEKICNCDQAKLQKPDETNPCSVNFTEYGCTEKKYNLGLWSSTYVKNPKDRNRVFAPPRRNSICIGWLFSPLESGASSTSSKDKAKEVLKQKIIDAAKGESHYLWKYYNKNGSNTTPPPGYCDALKRSFADIGDMVKGTDMWNAGYSPLVEKNIHAVFQLENDGKNNKLIKTKEELLDEKKQWWEKIRADVWKAMNCIENNKCNGSTIPDDDMKPQFLRWLEEWGEYICKEREKLLTEFKSKCTGSGNKINDGKCAKATEDCKKQCNKYNNWINIYKREWLGQKSKYKEIYDNKDYKKYVNTHKTSNDYINEKCDKCKNNDGKHINLDDVFKKSDEAYKKYEPFCTTCRIKDIAQKAIENTRVNPCGDNNGTKPTTSVKQVAKEMQNEAKKEAEGRMCGTTLEGDIEKAKFGKNGETTGVDNPCDLNIKTHTNDYRTYDANAANGKVNNKHSGPCTGKGEKGIGDGKKWQTKPREVKSGNEDVLFPPRRLDMCTSNLESLNTSNPGLSDGSIASHSLLADVMLSAKTEAEQIIKLYDQSAKSGAQNGTQIDDVTKCRAMKYSFADLGDIIRGKDMWSKEKGMAQLETYLVKIFEKIKTQLPTEIQTKYSDATEPYTKLRSDWWSANRDQIWKAMQCNGNANSACGTTPLNDYIPQKLRWFTEWAEWYCKTQKKHYDEVATKCAECKTKNGNCEDKCQGCKDKCKEYSQFIDKWKQDWETQKTQYEKYYKDAKDSNGSGSTGDLNKDYLNKFLKLLHEKNSGNNPFDTAAWYIHSVLEKNTGCKGQTKFCGENTDNDNVFRNYPNDYDNACNCNNDKATTQTTSSQAGQGSQSGNSQVARSADPVSHTTSTISGPGTSHGTAQTSQQPVPDQTTSGTGPTGGQPSGPPASGTVSHGSSGDPSGDPSGLARSGSSPTTPTTTTTTTTTPTTTTTTTTTTTEPPKNMNCVEEAANTIREEAKKNIKSELKGTGLSLNGECDKVDKVIQEVNGTITINNQKLKENFPEIADSCEKEGTDRFKIGKPWRCNNINKKHHNLCLPPRREHMCMKKIKDMTSRSVSDQNQLLEEVMKGAQDEGINILKNHKEQNQNQYSEICDAMKYSFADIGDIIRGRDLWRTNKAHERIEGKLKTIFRYINDNLVKENVNKYQYDGPKYLKLRSDWWDTNREDIWKAMTCVAPNNAKFKKRDKTGNTTSEDNKCGYGKITPVDDYIPQPFRWLTEWSEYYCKGKKKEYEKLKEVCKECKTNGSSCTDNADGTKCKECKSKCTSFGKFVQEWKSQLETQSKTYKELYKNATDTTDARTSPSTSGIGPKPRSLKDDDNKHIDNFLKKVKINCKNPHTADEYLHKATHCMKYIFLERKIYRHNYAFNDKPKNVQKKCNCKISSYPMDKCPFNVNNNHCNNFVPLRICNTKMYENELNNWNNKQILHNSGENTGVLLPPRRNHICIRNITSNLSRIKNMDYFKDELLKSAYTEGYYLRDKYKDQYTEALQSMKYSFADYGDIIKGTDMMDTTTKKIKGILENLLKNARSSANSISTSIEPKDVNDWWEKNKKHIWHAMLCGYKKAGGTLTINDCNVPDEDKTNQFLRWLEEWAEIFCKEKKKEAEDVISKCLNKIQDDKSIEHIIHHSCKNKLMVYKNWYLIRNQQWEGLKKAYVSRFTKHLLTLKKDMTQTNAEDYVKSKCSECDCNYKDLQEVYNISDKPQELFKKLVLKAKIDSIHPKDTPFYKFFTLRGDGPDIAKKALDNAKDIISKVTEYGVQSAKNVLNDLKEIIDKIKSSDSSKSPAEPSPAPATPPSPRSPLTPPGTQHDEPFNSDILSSTLPLGISFALGSIALLFYIKKKPVLRPTKLFRVIDIPQNDYGMPDETSTNRYVPYGKYKGKTYIYVERDDSEDDKYMFTSDTTDVTSSESEYEEMDINDIYPYKSPKYKTLIEVVLTPSTNNNVRNIHDNTTHTRSVKPSDISTNKLTDNEWNELKKVFISQYLNNIGNHVPLNNELQSYNIPKHIQPDIIHNNMEEKPFITSIQDRYLDKRHEYVTYNIDWNVPEKINRTTNNLDDPKYVSQNLYSGIDLINDSLNSDQHIDIYDELLKRKENELFETKHTKHTSTNGVLNGTYSDPISNQIDLFHKWLDRHRDMCNKWNNKEEMLNQLNEEWNYENKEHLLYTSTIDDINRINDENYNMINPNTQTNHEGNDKTTLEDCGSTNIPYSALITQNNDSQRQNLLTHISMDIHFDENNNNVTNEDDQLDNSYNF
ncbi:erythrocyte membrane protein 1, PfEMP1, putative [Plasmodium gaboni]|uniref:Erythrocyte membrane protein 1, PfEMP1, putative n=1 Tax=Plasmodium gaboni TaxID=647221 RepID=A0ABY1UKH1_9APIC|nr:erythrocyte membrane protein 1, PfEMP1, putative [Plasmodium gaboni]